MDAFFPFIVALSQRSMQQKSFAEAIVRCLAAAAVCAFLVGTGAIRQVQSLQHGAGRDALFGLFVVELPNPNSRQQAAPSDESFKERLQGVVCFQKRWREKLPEPI